MSLRTRAAQYLRLTLTCVRRWIVSGSSCSCCCCCCCCCCCEQTVPAISQFLPCTRLNTKWSGRTKKQELGKIKQSLNRIARKRNGISTQTGEIGRCLINDEFLPIERHGCQAGARLVVCWCFAVANRLSLSCCGAWCLSCMYASLLLVSVLLCPLRNMGRNKQRIGITTVSTYNTCRREPSERVPSSRLRAHDINNGCPSLVPSRSCCGALRLP